MGYTVDTDDTVESVDSVATVDSVDTVYTIEIALNCWNSSMYAFLLSGKDRTLLKWADQDLSSGMDDWMKWSIYALDCYDY